MPSSRREGFHVSSPMKQFHLFGKTPPSYSSFEPVGHGSRCRNEFPAKPMIEVMRAPIIGDRKLESVMVNKIDAHRGSLAQHRLDLADAGGDLCLIEPQIVEFVRCSRLIIDEC